MPPVLPTRAHPHCAIITPTVLIFPEPHPPRPGTRDLLGVPNPPFVDRIKLLLLRTTKAPVIVPPSGPLVGATEDAEVAAVTRADPDRLITPVSIAAKMKIYKSEARRQQHGVRKGSGGRRATPVFRGWAKYTPELSNQGRRPGDAATAGRTGGRCFPPCLVGLQRSYAPHSPLEAPRR